jgi:hypothetical protein
MGAIGGEFEVSGVGKLFDLMIQATSLAIFSVPKN